MAETAGGPQVLIGGGKNPAWRKIAEYGDGWFPIYPADPAALVEEIAELRARAAEPRPGAPVTVMNAPPDRAALAALADAGVQSGLFWS